MGCFQSKEPEPDDPMMDQFARTQDLKEKAEIALALSIKEEQRGRVHKAVVAVGLWLACKAVEMYKEYEKTQRKELVELALHCRRMATHRALLQQRAIRAAAAVCFGPPYIPSDPPGPVSLAPYQWNEFLVMAKGSGDVIRALEKMGVLEPQERPKPPPPAPVQEDYDRPVYNFNIPAAPQIIMPSINISNNPTFSQTGPTTSIQGGNNDAHVAPTISSAQTGKCSGEGNVAPMVGPHAGASNAQSQYAPQTQTVDTAQSYFAPQKVLNEQSHYAPTAQAYSGGLPADAPPKMPAGYTLVPDGSGGFYMVPAQQAAGPGTVPAMQPNGYPAPGPQAVPMPIPQQTYCAAPPRAQPGPCAAPPAAYGIPPPAPGTPLPANCGMGVPPPPLGYPQTA